MIKNAKTVLCQWIWITR